MGNLARTALRIGVVVVFAGCGGWQPPIGATVTPRAAASSAPLFRTEGWPKKPILFVSDPYDNVVRMYDPNKPNSPAEGKISDGIELPSGLAVDSKGSLYVSNYSGITIYSFGTRKPRFTIHTPPYYGLAVDSKGDVFASDVDGFVSAYKPNKKKPYETIYGVGNPRGLAVDSKDNVWVADDGYSKVWEIPAGTKQLKDAGLEDVNQPDGLAFGPGDILYVSNWGPRGRSRQHHNVTVYRSGSKKPAYRIRDGVAGPLLSGVTATGFFFQSTDAYSVVGYKPGERKPFSTITIDGVPNGIASFPEVKK